MRTVSPALLRQMINQSGNVHVINVLPSESFPEARIPGSVDVPFRRETRGPGAHHVTRKPEEHPFVEDVLRSVGDLEARVVVCFTQESPELRPVVTDLLERAGFRDVLALEGDPEEWEDEYRGG